MMDVQSDFRTAPKFSCIVIFSLIYAGLISSRLRPGLPRFLFLLPVISILPLIPFLFSTIHFRTNAAFFLGWLCLFKLLLFSFGQGPLNPSLYLISFISLASLSVKLLTKTNSKGTNSSPNFKSPKFLLSTAVKAALFAGLLALYCFRNQIHPHILSIILKSKSTLTYCFLYMHCLDVYYSLEVMLSTTGILAGLLLGMELEPQFNKPYFATSLRDFWGRRWNVMVSAVLRPSIYDPIRASFGHDTAVIVAFAVSGIMHELIFYYLTLLPPTGEAMLFFLLHGVCTAIEGWWDRHDKWYRPPKILGTVGTFAFVAGTSFWLSFRAMFNEDVLDKWLLEIEE